jgi:2-polyprenyl-6-hydroxyphenyl methylase/3-demethylubiquinone-9 3-methyltransferase
MQEQDVFSRSAESWWDTDGPFKMLHKMNPVRLAFVKQTLSNLGQLNILDYACGGGLFSELLCRQGAHVTGVDTSAASIHFAKQHAIENELRINYVHGTIDDLDERFFAQDAFDAVCALECVEHVDRPEQLIASLASALKPGGHLFISTLNRSWYTYCMGIIAAEYLLGWVEPGTHNHGQFIRPSELANMCRRAQLDIKQMAGMTFDMSNQSFLLSDDVSLNYIVCLQKAPHRHAGDVQ